MYKTIIKNKQGFSMVQLIVTMVILLILAASVFVWIDPLARIGEAKNKTRIEHVNIIAAAISEYASDHKGNLPISGEVFSGSGKILCSSKSSVALTCMGIDRLCLTLDSNFYKYLPALPVDPDKSSTADTGYYLQKDSDKNLIVGACDSYDSETITKRPGVKVLCDLYAGGYCWYEGSNNTSCDATCSSNNLECIRNAIYDSGLDSSERYFCELGELVYPDLGVTCEIAPTSTPNWFGPLDYGAQTRTFSCSKLAGSNRYPVCACE